MYLKHLSEGGGGGGGRGEGEGGRGAYLFPACMKGVGGGGLNTEGVTIPFLHT